MSGGDGPVYALAQLNNGQLVAGGSFTSVRGFVRRGMAWFDTTSGLMPAQGPALDRGAVRVILPLDDTRVFAGGEFSTAGSASHWGVAILNAGAASADAFFGKVCEPGQAHCLKLCADGTVLVGGDFVTVGNPQSSTGGQFGGLIRLTPAGNLDPTFYGGPFNGAVRSVLEAKTGKLWVGGDFTLAHNTDSSPIAYLGATGGLESAFGVTDALNIRGFKGGLKALAIPSINTLIAGGDFIQVGGYSLFFAARIAFGSFDYGFLSNARFSGTVVSLALQPDGKVLAVGPTSSSKGVNIISRLLSTGAPDTAYQPLPNGAVNQVVSTTQSRLLAGGDFSVIGQRANARIARLLPDGTADPSFDAGAGPNAAVGCLAEQTDGKVLIAGAFSSVAGRVRNNVARLQADGSLDLLFDVGAAPNGSVNAMAALGDWVLAGGDFTTLGGVPRQGLALLSGTSTLSAPSSTAPQDATAISASEVVLRWNKSVGASGYILQASVDGINGWMTVDVAASASDSTQLPAQGSGGAAFYRVAAFNGAGVTAFSSPLAVVAPASFAEWRTAAGVPAVASDLADLNGDGLPLLMEYALERSALNVEPAPLPQAVLNGALLQMSYRKARADVTYLVEASVDLKTWSREGVPAPFCRPGLFLGRWLRHLRIARGVLHWRE